MLAYSDSPAGDRLAVDESADRLVVTILPSGTWRAFLWHIPVLAIGVLNAAIPYIMQYKIRSRFGLEMPSINAWVPAAIMLSVTATFLMLSRFEGARRSIITVDSQTLSVRRVGKLRDRTRQVGVKEIADIRLRFFTHVAIVTHAGKYHEWISGGHLSDRRWLVQVLRQRIGLT